jgi:hypothetical protein
MIAAIAALLRVPLVVSCLCSNMEENLSLANGGGREPESNIFGQGGLLSLIEDAQHGSVQRQVRAPRSEHLLHLARSF